MTFELKLRPIRPADEPMLLNIYAKSRALEMAMVPWSADEKAAFLAQQFQAQHAHYTREFSAAQFDLVMKDGVPVGRFYVDRRRDAFHILDIAVLPEFQRQGIGKKLIGDLCREAKQAGLPVTLSVEQGNPARELYERWGFQVIAENASHFQMKLEDPALTSISTSNKSTTP